jgi:hypothetical protein
MTDWARALSFHSFGSSAAALSSASRALARSQSKMPPQQTDGLPDFFNDGLDFGAHSILSARIYVLARRVYSRASGVAFRQHSGRCGFVA